jgi:hypothetical protein
MDYKNVTSALSYSPETGEFRWAAPRPKVRVGQIAGHIKKKTGYAFIEVDGKCYAAHRLAWFFMTGLEPTGQIDHINRNRSDNRFENLRIATNGQNRANSRTTNKHGLKGVRFIPWMKKEGKCWEAKITHGKKFTIWDATTPKRRPTLRTALRQKKLMGIFTMSNFS